MTDLIAELRHVDQFPVLFAVDGYNAWHSPTGNYFAGDRLTAQQLATPRALNFLTTRKQDNTEEGYPMENGLCIGAVPATHPVSDKMRSEEHTSELQSLMRNSHDVVCMTKKPISTSHMTQKNNYTQKTTQKL